MSEPKIINIESNLYDECTIYTNCTVEVWKNSVTGEISYGWYKTDNTEEISK